MFPGVYFRFFLMVYFCDPVSHFVERKMRPLAPFSFLQSVVFLLAIVKLKSEIVFCLVLSVQGAFYLATEENIFLRYA